MHAHRRQFGHMLHSSQVPGVHDVGAVLILISGNKTARAVGLFEQDFFRLVVTKPSRCGQTLKIENIDVDSAIGSVKTLLEKERDLSPSLKAAPEVLLLLVAMLLNRTTLNSKNSSKPPSSDPNREKSSRKGESARKPGGQKGRIGTTLKQVDDPDTVKELNVDRRSLPRGRQYQEDGYETRQVIDIDIARFVTEYRAQVLKDDQGNRFVAAFPEKVSRPVQYGIGIKANAVYMSQFQLLPYDRIRDHFQEQMRIPVSARSVFNFNKEAYEQLDGFELWAKAQLATSDLMHVDETGINVDGKRHWLHCASNSALTLLYPHTKRGTEAMDEMGGLALLQRGVVSRSLEALLPLRVHPLPV